MNISSENIESQQMFPIPAEKPTAVSTEMCVPRLVQSLKTLIEFSQNQNIL